MNKQSILIIGTFLYDNSTPFPQAKLLSDLLEGEGYKTACVSEKRNKILRLFDICYRALFDDYDHLFVQIFSGPAFIYASFAIIIAWLRNKKIVGVLRGGNLPNYLQHFKWLKLRILSKAQLLISPSGYLKNAFDKLGLRTEIIPNIVDLKKYTSRHRSSVQPKILWIRRYIDLYNPLMAVRAIKIIKQSYKNVHLTMAGGGDNKWVRDFIKNEGLENNVTLLGFVSKEEINNLGQQHDIFINTANIDNFPVTVVESMAMGMLVISTNVGGIPYLLTDGVNAQLVDKNDELAMANSVIKLCNDPELADKLCTNTQKTVSGFSWDAIKLKYLDIFKS